MAISNNPFLQGVSGSLGKDVTVKNYSGKTVICKKIGPRQKPASKDQKQNESLFGQANEAASEIYADPAERKKAGKRLGQPEGRGLYQAIVKECREALEAEQNKPRARK